MFYDPTALAAEEVELLRQYSAERGLAAPLTRDEFAERVFLTTAWDRRGLIVGHNLPFDLARISIDNAPCRSRDASMRGGFTLALSTDQRRSRVQVKRINAGAPTSTSSWPASTNPPRSRWPPDACNVNELTKRTT